MLVHPSAWVGFVTIPSTENASLLLRWSMPSDSRDTSGLGGGLTFAVEPDFCSKLMPHFNDRRWIDCEMVDDAIHRAFASWSANHQMVSFVNVSSHCANDVAVVQCREAYGCEQMSGSAQDNCLAARGNCTRSCDAAEIVILAQASFPHSVVDTIAAVAHWDRLETNVSESVAVSDRGPRLTTGTMELRDGIIRRATVTFLRRDCYYLDSTFCAGLHRIERDSGSVLVYFSLFTMPFFALAVVLLAIRFVISVKVLLKHKRGWALGVRDAIRSLAEPLADIWIILFLVTLCPFLYFSVAQPCMRCDDFEASMAHEIGMVLGLGQPNALGNVNYALVGALNATNCMEQASILPGRSGALAALSPRPVGDDQPMMDVLKTRSVQPCPTADDLQGLNLLYPTCELTRQSAPLCFKSLENVGLLRLMTTVGLSLAISFMVAACLSKGSQWFEKIKLEVKRLADETAVAQQIAAVQIQARFRGQRVRREGSAVEP